MSKIGDKIERALCGATAAEVVEMRIELAARRAQQRIEQRIIAALELPDEAHRCLTCGGEGYVQVADSYDEVKCAACGGAGLRAEQAEGEA